MTKKNQLATAANARHELDLNRATDLVMQLMRIPGKSGEEAAIAEFVVETLRRAGAPDAAIHTDSAHQRTPIAGQTGNLALRLPGTKRGPRRLLSAHLDTVPICVGSEPVQQNGVVRSANPATGLGADDRAGVAAILTAAVEILEHGLPHPPLTFCWFVQEENGLQGVRCMSKGILGKPVLGFNFDGGSATKLTIGATGGYRLKIEIRGIASHAGGAPECGVSAIAIAGLAIADLHREGWHGDIRKGRNHGTSNIGFIQGGEATNVVTDHVTIRAEARSHDPKFRQRIVREIERAFKNAVKQVRNSDGKTGSVEFEGRLDYESFCLSSEEPCVKIAAQAADELGRPCELAIANGGLDANWLVQHGIPTVSLGCGQRNQHMVSEELDVAQFHDACRIALRLATG